MFDTFIYHRISLLQVVRGLGFIYKGLFKHFRREIDSVCPLLFQMSVHYFICSALSHDIGKVLNFCSFKNIFLWSHIIILVKQTIIFVDISLI